MSPSDLPPLNPVPYPSTASSLASLAPALINPQDETAQQQRTVFYLILCIYLALGTATIPILVRGAFNPGAPLHIVIDTWFLATPGVAFTALFLARNILQSHHRNSVITTVNTLILSGILMNTLRLNFSTTPYNTFFPLITYLASELLLIGEAWLLTTTILLPIETYPHPIKVFFAKLFARRLHHFTLVTIVMLFLALVVTAFIPQTPSLKIAFPAIITYLFLGIFLWIGSLYAMKNEFQTSIKPQLTLNLPELPVLSSELPIIYS
jgi:hypothetical protein